MSSLRKMQSPSIRAPTAKAAVILAVCLVFSPAGLAAGLSAGAANHPSPTRRQAARCLLALSRGVARAVFSAAPLRPASEFGVFARAPRASDGLPRSARLSERLGALDATTYFPRDLRLLRRDRQDALYIVPAILTPRRVPGACGLGLRALAAQIVGAPSVRAIGPGVCMVETVTVNRSRTQGEHPEIASGACLPVRSVGGYAEFLPRIDDALGREYALAPDSVPAVTFLFSGQRRRTVAARDNLIELPSPVSFTTGPRPPTLTTFARHLAALLPPKVIVRDVTYARPSGLVIELSRRLLAEDRLLALAGGGGSVTWSL